jgi:hypothetical protein
VWPLRQGRLSAKQRIRCACLGNCSHAQRARRLRAYVGLVARFLWHAWSHDMQACDKQGVGFAAGSTEQSACGRVILPAFSSLRLGLPTCRPHSPPRPIPPRGQCDQWCCVRRVKRDRAAPSCPVSAHHVWLPLHDPMHAAGYRSACGHAQRMLSRGEVIGAQPPVSQAVLYQTQHRFNRTCAASPQCRSGRSPKSASIWLAILLPRTVVLLSSGKCRRRVVQWNSAWRFAAPRVCSCPDPHSSVLAIRWLHGLVEQSCRQAWLYC